MLDSALRPVKDRIFAPLVATRLGRVHPTTISIVGLALTLGAAVSASQRLPVLAVLLWLGGRTADGIDGLAARRTDRATDVGGLLDFMFDTIGYASIPIGLAFGVDTRVGWIVTAVLLASFYVNSVSLGYVSALIEKRGTRGHGTTVQGATVQGSAVHSATSVVLPRGLVEGTETIVFFTLALALPDVAPFIWAVMATAVLFTAFERLHWASRRLV